MCWCKHLQRWISAICILLQTHFSSLAATQPSAVRKWKSAEDGVWGGGREGGTGFNGGKSFVFSAGSETGITLEVNSGGVAMATRFRNSLQRFCPTQSPSAFPLSSAFVLFQRERFSDFHVFEFDAARGLPL